MRKRETGDWKRKLEQSEAEVAELRAENAKLKRELAKLERECQEARELQEKLKRIVDERNAEKRSGNPEREAVELARLRRENEELRLGKESYKKVSRSTVLFLRAFNALFLSQ